MPSQKMIKKGTSITRMPLCLFYFGTFFAFFAITIKAQVFRVACVGDSITQGARVDSDTQSYPARLSEILGTQFLVKNFGVGGATMLREGKPTVWSEVKEIQQFDPHFIILALGTNDTVEGNRRNWSRIEQFEPDCKDLLKKLLSLPSRPTVCLAGPTSMVLETTGLSEQRRTNLLERKPRLEQLRGVLSSVVEQLNNDQLYFLNLASVFDGRPELITQSDGVHPNEHGYRELALVIARSIQSKHQMAPEVRKDLWHGFERQHFKINSKSAWVVAPIKAAPGRPWIWRARFPGFHSEMDQQLVGHGFHVGYVDVAGLFGAPEAMETGDAFYQFVTKRYQLSSQPVMEGVSRGGLFVYHWSIRHPERVSAIYCDTPVCDPKSWPGGQGEGMGSTRDWSRFMEVNDLTPDTSRDYFPPVFRHFEILVRYQIPIMHIISDNDTVVPPSENTLRLDEYFKSQGYSMELIRVPKGTRSSHGHHFKHPQPDRVVRFIRSHAK